MWSTWHTLRRTIGTPPTHPSHSLGPDALALELQHQHQMPLLLLSLFLRPLLVRGHPLHHRLTCTARCSGPCTRDNRSLSRICIDCHFIWRWIRHLRLQRPTFSRSHGQESSPLLMGGRALWSWRWCQSYWRYDGRPGSCQVGPMDRLGRRRYRILVFLMFLSFNDFDVIYCLCLLVLKFVLN